MKSDIKYSIIKQMIEGSFYNDKYGFSKGVPNAVKDRTADEEHDGQRD